MVNSFLIVAALLADCIAAAPTSHVIHESRDPASVSSRWVQKGRVASDALLPVRVGLAQSNLDKGEEMLLDVSDPDSPNYGKHWTSDQVTDFFKPSDESTAAVKSWLESNGFSDLSLSDNKAWIAFNAPASKVESLLHAEFYEFEDSITKSKVPSTHAYSVPKELQQHIDFIAPGLKLLPRSRASKTRAQRTARSAPSPQYSNYGLSTCDEAVNPDCLAALYKIPKATLTPNPANQLGLYESIFQRWDPTDLNLFFTNYTHGSIPNGTEPVNKAVDGGESETPHHFVSITNGGEIELDLDVAYPIVYPQKIYIYDEDDLHYQRVDIANLTTTFGFNQLLDALDGSYCTYSAYGETGDDPNLDPKYPDPEKHGGFNGSLECGVYKPPYVFSSSYGGQEVDVPIAYQARQCNEFMKLGLQGTSIFFASGDAGVADLPASQGGDSPTGCTGSNSNYTVFNPAWPNSCPYLTNVGATEVAPGATVGGSDTQPEVAVFFPDPNPELIYSSGGGFSNIYPRPSYQQAAVEEYLTKHKPPYKSYSDLAKIVPNPAKVNVNALQGKTGGLYNSAGRGYPDVSCNGANATIVLHGLAMLESGTSQATPIFASIINRIVEERLAAGKSSLGFLNPAFYKNSSIFNDVIKGHNAGCGTNGFDTAPGWDPVSGLGTPDYPKMLAYFMSLPSGGWNSTSY